ncbi:response regulator [Actinoplanes sp. NPDC051851]|uniref:response regulator n=1 Tax=Actinoplanes sp. NPDC051851 TaxID=3154753 RepID=UPI003413B1BA
MAVLLIAEDDEDIAAVIARVCKRAGLTVLRAPDGQVALEMIIKERPDVLLTDLGMPRMDGWELIRAVRAHDGVRDTPVAILTGQLTPGDPRVAEAHACAILMKPCPNDQLLLMIEKLATVGPHGHSGAESRCPVRNPVTV